MNWLLWSSVATGVYFLAKKPESAVLVPISPHAPTPLPGNGAPPITIDNPGVVNVNQGGVPAAPTPAPATPKPTTVTKVVITNGRKYTVTRAGLGIYKVALASDPTVFQLITQTGPLQESGDPKKLAQLKADEAQFPGNLFS